MTLGLQFSLTPREAGDDQYGIWFKGVTNALRLPLGMPFRINVVNGWAGDDGDAIYNRVRILSPNGDELFNATQENVIENRLTVVVQQCEFHLTEAGWHTIEVYSGDTFFLHYPVHLSQD